ncbi:MAG: hypothetical protein K2Q11_08640 [Burkholderiaceae bacterium]|nr:hypothetical protein [Burkholderiaceae bacterium]
MSISAIDFLWSITKGTAAATAVIAALPILGGVGAVSVAGAVVAVGVGTVAATIDAIKKD